MSHLFYYFYFCWMLISSNQMVSWVMSPKLPKQGLGTESQHESLVQEGWKMNV